MNMERDGGMILTGVTKQLGEKPVPVQHSHLQIPHGLYLARSRASAVRGRRLSQGTAL
jgi:hypothetical protein